MNKNYDAVRLLRSDFICPHCGYDEAIVEMPPKQRADGRLSICEAESFCQNCDTKWITVFDIVGIREA